ncbi:hypothetical protein VTJ04DRAFT_7 [Mycothermus thermophilus]|uniref:uncharacterized protein n=1 Tax=Humicola insolens TaxID=85995 RepID=UPI0037428F28
MDNPPLTDPKMWRAVIIAEDTAAFVPSCRHVLETTLTPTNYVSLQRISSCAPGLRWRSADVWLPESKVVVGTRRLSNEDLLHDLQTGDPSRQIASYLRLWSHNGSDFESYIRRLLVSWHENVVELDRLSLPGAFRRVFSSSYCLMFAAGTVWRNFRESFKAAMNAPDHEQKSATRIH